MEITELMCKDQYLVVGLQLNFFRYESTSIKSSGNVGISINYNVPQFKSKSKLTLSVLVG